MIAYSNRYMFAKLVVFHLIYFVDFHQLGLVLIGLSIYFSAFKSDFCWIETSTNAQARKDEAGILEICGKLPTRINCNYKSIPP